MREIKFRGKRKWGIEILTGDLNHINGGVYIFPRGTDTPLNSPDWFEVEPDSVGQFTGLKDMLQKEIFEFDFIESIQGIEFQVYYQSGAFRWDGVPLIEDDHEGYNDCITWGSVTETL